MSGKMINTGFEDILKFSVGRFTVIVISERNKPKLIFRNMPMDYAIHHLVSTPYSFSLIAAVKLIGPAPNKASKKSK